MLFIPVHLRRPLLLLGVDLHLHLGRRRAQAHLCERVVQRAAILVRQLQGKEQRLLCFYFGGELLVFFFLEGSVVCACVRAHLRAVAADGGARGPGGASGGAAVHQGADGAVADGGTLVV